MKRAAQHVVDHAEARSDAARKALIGTVSELRLRLDPRVLAAHRLEQFMAKAQMTVYALGHTARSRPVATTGGLVAFVLAVILRLWLARTTKSTTPETSADQDS